MGDEETTEAPAVDERIGQLCQIVSQIVTDPKVTPDNLVQLVATLVASHQSQIRQVAALKATLKELL